MDIIDKLTSAANDDQTSYEVADDTVRVGCNMLKEAAAEIRRLRADIVLMRSIVGKALDGGTASFREIKNASRFGDSDVLGKFNPAK